MREAKRICETIVTLLLLALPFPSQNVVAGNSVTLVKQREDVLLLQLSSSDGIAGLQFSINGRGGVVLLSYEGTDRTDAAGMGIYQYRINDSTLNVVILAPVRSALPCGAGSIGRITFSESKTKGADTVRVFLTKIVICDKDARYLDFTTEQATWNSRTASDEGQSLCSLRQNFPNPFNPSTTITYSIQKPAHVHLEVYDIAGRLISTLVDGEQSKGQYSAKWNSTDDRGAMLASGMYFARLRVENQTEVTKMILAK